MARRPKQFRKQLLRDDAEAKVRLMRRPDVPRLVVSVSKIATGASVGQFVMLAASPVITRLYSAEAFGIFSLVWSLSAVLTVLIGLRLDSAVPLPRDDEEARSLVSVSMQASLALGLVALLLASLYALFFGLDGNVAIGDWVLVVPVLALLGSWFIVLTRLAMRREQYGLIAQRSIVQSTAVSASQIGLGLWSPTPGGLVGGAILGRVLAVASLVWTLGVRPFRRLRDWRNGQNRRILVKYQRFPKMLMPAALMNAAAVQLPILTVGWFFSPQDAGYVGLAQRMMIIPAALIGQAVATVYWGEAAKRRRSSNATSKTLFLRASRALAAIAIPIGAFLIAFGPVTFALVFGEEWRTSGEFARIMAPMLVAQLIVAPLSQSLILAGKFHVQLIWDGTRLGVMAAGSWLIVLSGGSAPVMVGYLVVVSTVSYGILWLLSLRSLTQEAENDWAW